MWWALSASPVLDRDNVSAKICGTMTPPGFYGPTLVSVRSTVGYDVEELWPSNL